MQAGSPEELPRGADDPELHPGLNQRAQHGGRGGSPGQDQGHNTPAEHKTVHDSLTENRLHRSQGLRIPAGQAEHGEELPSHGQAHLAAGGFRGRRAQPRPAGAPGRNQEADQVGHRADRGGLPGGEAYSTRVHIISVPDQIRQLLQAARQPEAGPVRGMRRGPQAQGQQRDHPHDPRHWRRVPAQDAPAPPQAGSSPPGRGPPEGRPQGHQDRQDRVDDWQDVYNRWARGLLRRPRGASGSEDRLARED